MQSFTIRKDGIKEMNREVIIKLLPVLIIAGLVGLSIPLINSKDKELDLTVLPVLIPIVAASMWFGINRGLKRQKLLYENYLITITDNLITRKQINTISIYFNEIKEIEKRNNGSFIIKGKTSGEMIFIPSQIDHYSELEQLLEQIQPIIKNKSRTINEKYAGFTGLITVGLMFCVFTVNNKIIVGLTGILLMAIIIWSFIKIRGNKNLDNKTKGGVWWSILVLLSVISVLYFKLTK